MTGYSRIHPRAILAPRLVLLVTVGSAVMLAASCLSASDDSTAIGTSSSTSMGPSSTLVSTATSTVSSVLGTTETSARSVSPPELTIDAEPTELAADGALQLYDLVDEPCLDATIVDGAEPTVAIQNTCEFAVSYIRTCDVGLSWWLLDIDGEPRSINVGLDRPCPPPAALYLFVGVAAADHNPPWPPSNGEKVPACRGAPRELYVDRVVDSPSVADEIAVLRACLRDSTFG